MKDKIKEILINRLGTFVKSDVLDELSTEIDQMVRHSQFLQTGRKDNITILELINDTARSGDIFKYGDDYCEVVGDSMCCGFHGMECKDCPFTNAHCMKLKGFEKL